MNDFWHPLCNHLNIISNSENPHMRLLMFIVNSLEVEMDSYDICCLKPELKIDYGDVKDWFEIKEVKSYMECARGITNHKNFVKKEAPNLNYENLPKLLGTLASYANPQVDFNDIKKCWIIGE